jgi:hypothetical protein
MAGPQSHPSRSEAATGAVLIFQLAFFFRLLLRFDCPDSDMAMATACLRLRTFFPLRLFKPPCLYSDITLCTLRRLPDFVCGLRAAKMVTSF